MPGRSNLEQRAQRTYGAPTSPPAVRPRDEERRRLLETKPTAEQRARAIEKQVNEGQAETARSTGTRTAAPAPEPLTVGKPGRSTEETLRTRSRDVAEAIEDAGG